MSGGTLQLHPDDYLGRETRSVALFRITAERNGKKLNSDFCEVVRWKNGQVAEDWGFAFDQRAFDVSGLEFAAGDANTASCLA